ncbi:MAG: cobalt-precorrin-5B (C(1))-methyltransferase [Magnetococcales bacterium]|nr:cobalt-precorrin-5B (C(1))-methyltransferase [Magnetococcales bacterium]
MTHARRTPPQGPPAKASGGKRTRGDRTGFTTGSCAAAAARAAAEILVTERIPTSVVARLANGEAVAFAVGEAGRDTTGAWAVVVKDAGDDPDCTHGAHLTARVERLPGEAGRLELTGGAGIGTVTRPGLEIPPGAAAINPVPRRNILENVEAVAATLLAVDGLRITLSVPGGEAMAAKTLNPRLGIEGGISILGTSGIVHPYSTAAFRRAVQQAIDVAAANGVGELVLTTGRRTERFAMLLHPHLPPHQFIQMGDFLGAALERVAAGGFSRVVIAAMAGKLAKIAQGFDNTHARRRPLDLEPVAGLAAEIGAPVAIVTSIRQGITVRNAAELLDHVGLKPAFFARLAAAAHAEVRRRLPPGMKSAVLALDYEGAWLAEAGDNPRTTVPERDR